MLHYGDIRRSHCAGLTKKATVAALLFIAFQLPVQAQESTPTDSVHVCLDSIDVFEIVDQFSGPGFAQSGVFIDPTTCSAGDEGYTCYRIVRDTATLGLRMFTHGNRDTLDLALGHDWEQAKASIDNIYLWSNGAEYGDTLHFADREQRQYLITMEKGRQLPTVYRFTDIDRPGNANRPRDVFMTEADLRRAHFGIRSREFEYAVYYHLKDLGLNDNHIVKVHGPNMVNELKNRMSAKNRLDKELIQYERICRQLSLQLEDAKERGDLERQLDVLSDLRKVKKQIRAIQKRLDECLY